jgi:hypothetical protein
MPGGWRSGRGAAIWWRWGMGASSACLALGMLSAGTLLTCSEV